MINSFISLFFKLLSFFKWPVIVIVCIVLFFWILIRIFLLVEMKKTGMKPKKAKHSHKKVKTPVLKRIFYQFPKIMAHDILTREPDAFPYQGIYIFEGDQGDGKSIALVEMTRRMQLEYPDVKCVTNFDYSYEDEQLTHWSQLIDFSNGIYGVICNIDEVQNWLSCQDSKNFPPEMLETVTQNRKNRRFIGGTCQRYYMMAKHMRTQCREVRSCKTFFNCVTFVCRKKPIYDSEGCIKTYRFLGMYWFVHTVELRESYDTYKQIKRLVESGITPKNERYNRVDVNSNDMMKRFMEG